MILPVEKTYEVCRRTLTVTYRHTATINGQRLCAQIAASQYELRGMTAMDIDAELERKIMRVIRNELYKDAQ